MKKSADSRPHPTVLVEVGDKSERIDVELAPLIREMWRAGINTVMSCQNCFEGCAWIEFDSAEELTRFFGMIVYYEPHENSLYRRITRTQRDLDAELSWEFELHVHDMFEDQPEQIEYGIACYFASVGAYFPRSDIQELHRRLSVFNGCESQN